MPHDTAEIDALIGLVVIAGDELGEREDLPAHRVGLFNQYAVLRHQAHILVNEQLALHRENRGARDDHRHKLRQHNARLQAFLTELRATA